MIDVSLKLVPWYRLTVMLFVHRRRRERCVMAAMVSEEKSGRAAGDARRGAGARPEPTWVPANACTLPSADRPARLAEFEGLFGSLRGLRRERPSWLRLWLEDADGVEERARDLTAREASCCSFFSFDVHREAGGVVVDVRVPEDRVVVLDGLAEQARAAR